MDLDRVRSNVRSWCGIHPPLSTKTSYMMPSLVLFATSDRTRWTPKHGLNRHRDEDSKNEHTVTISRGSGSHLRALEGASVQGFLQCKYKDEGRAAEVQLAPSSAASGGQRISNGVNARQEIERTRNSVTNIAWFREVRDHGESRAEKDPKPWAQYS